MRQETKVVVVGAALALVAVSGARPAATATAPIRVAISEQGNSAVHPTSARFTLDAGESRDSGTASITPSEGPVRFRDGQHFRTVGGTDFLSGRHGELIIRWTGVSVRGGPGTDVVYGTWRILDGFGTGRYKSWKGGGRWAATDDGRRYTVSWEGLVTP